MRDTDMLLTVDLDIADAQATAKELDKEVQGIFSSRNGKQSAALTSVESQIKQSLYKVRELREALLRTAETPIPTEQYATLSKHLEEYVNEYDSLIEKANQLEEADQLDSAAYLKVATRIEQVETQMDALTRRKEELERTNQAYIDGKESDLYKKREVELDKALDKLKQQLIHRREIEKNEKGQLHTQTQITSRLRQVPRLLMRYALGVSSIYVLWRKIRQAISEGLQNLKDSDVGDYKDIVNDLNASTLTLKNTLASALAPILTAIIPYIQSFIDSLSDALDKLAQLIAAARGQTTYIRAIRQTGDAIERMGKQANKALSPLDNLNVITATPTMFEEAQISEETFAQLDDFLTKLDLLKDTLKVIAGLALASKILEFVGALGELSGSSALRELASGAGKLAKVVGFLGKLAAIGAITISLLLLIDWVLKEKTGMGLGDWVGSFLAGTTEWQQEFDEWWENNVNQPVESAVIELFTSAPKKVSENSFIQSLWTAAWKLLTPAGWKSMFIDEPLSAIQSLTDMFKKSGEEAKKASPDLFTFASAWDELTKMFGKKAQPQTDTTGISRLTTAIQTAIDKWKELKGLTDEDMPRVAAAIEEEVNKKKAVENVLADPKAGQKQLESDLKSFAYDPLQASIDVQKRMQDSLEELVNNVKNTPAPVYNRPVGRIRGYATGQVIPPSMSAHLAVLGDNKTETEVVSPLSTMQQAMMNALQQAGFAGNGTQEIVLNLDGREFMRAMVKQNSEYKKQHNGASAFA